MRLLQITLFLLFSFSSMSMVSAQKGGDYPKPVLKQTDNLNALLVSEDASLALTDEQRAQVLDIYSEMMTGIKAVKAAAGGDDVKAKSREVRQTANKKIATEVLTEAQAKARRVAQKKARG